MQSLSTGMLVLVFGGMNSDAGSDFPNFLATVSELLVVANAAP